MARWRSFVLRCWQDGEGETGQPPAWRYVIQEVGPAEQRRAFGSLAALLLFLQTELSATDTDQIEAPDT